MSSKSDTNSPVTFKHTYDDETPPSIAIIQAICVAENIDPVDAPGDLGFTLYDHVDPEALDRIIKEDTTDTDVCVELLFAGYHVRITHGQIDVRPVS